MLVVGAQADRAHRNYSLSSCVRLGARGRLSLSAGGVPSGITRTPALGLRLVSCPAELQPQRDPTTIAGRRRAAASRQSAGLAAIFGARRGTPRPCARAERDQARANSCWVSARRVHGAGRASVISSARRHGSAVSPRLATGRAPRGRCARRPLAWARRTISSTSGRPGRARARRGPLSSLPKRAP